jgi:arylsulfatase A-like enzyme
VLLIVLDTLRADHLGAYGYPRDTTPNLDRIAAQSTLFERAYSTASWTLPSHASMFTARRLNEHLALVTPMDTRYPTLAEFLAERGYTTSAFVANLSQTQRATGLGRGFQLFEDYYGDVFGMLRASGYGSVVAESLPGERPGVEDEKDAATVVAQFSRWLPSRPTAPFFTFLNFVDVHWPYIPPPPFDRRFTDTPPGASKARPRMRPIVRNLNPYDGELAYMDAQLGVLFETLAAQDVLDDTLLFIVSDHGEEFGEHSEGGHGHTVHRELLHVPLIVRYPATVPVGRRLAATVSLQDLAPTILDLTGLQSGSPFPGTSLVVEWAGRPGGEPPLPRIAFSELMGYRSRNAGYSKSLFTDDWHLIVNEKTRRPSLYDAVRDPLEQDDLWETQMGREVIATLGRHLESLLPPDQWQMYREFVLPDED